MKKTLLLTFFAAMLLTSCNLVGCGGKLHIEGSRRQPIMHGWTLEQAGEFWLASDLDTEREEVINGNRQWMTAEELAHFRDENVGILLTIAPAGTDPQPHNAAIYRQPDSNGTITFNLDTQALATDTVLTEALTAAGVTARQLLTVGTATLDLHEPRYSDQGTPVTCYVQRRGRGLYTFYLIGDRGTRSHPHGRLYSIPAVAAVHPGADSLTICRGNMLGPDYVAE